MSLPPVDFTITEFAALVGRPRHVIAYLCQTGQLPALKLGRGRNCKLRIPVAALRRDFPDLWEALAQNVDLARELERDAA